MSADPEIDDAPGGFLAPEAGCNSEAQVNSVEGGRGDDLGVLTGRLLFAVQGELFQRLRDEGFDDIVPRHGVVLAYLRPEGIRGTDLARLSGQLKQVVGVIVDDLEKLGYVERKPDPADRRAKLVVPTVRGRKQMDAADSIMADIMKRHARKLGTIGRKTRCHVLGLGWTRDDSKEAKPWTRFPRLFPFLAGGSSLLGRSAAWALR